MGTTAPHGYRRSGDRTAGVVLHAALAGLPGPGAVGRPVAGLLWCGRIVDLPRLGTGSNRTSPRERKDFSMVALRSSDLDTTDAGRHDLSHLDRLVAKARS